MNTFVQTLLVLRAPVWLIHLTRGANYNTILEEPCPV